MRIIGPFLNWLVSGDGLVFFTTTLVLITISIFAFSSPYSCENSQLQQETNDDSDNINLKWKKKFASNEFAANNSLTKPDKTARQTTFLQTGCGEVSVTVVGHASSRANILTLHDFGLTHRNCFNSFFQRHGDAAPFSSFCVYHIDFPGLFNDKIEKKLNQLDLNKLSEVITVVCEHFDIRSFVGFGVGIGGNVLLRYASNNASTVEALMLIGVSRKSAELSEWATLNVLLNCLRYWGMSDWVASTIISKLFSGFFYATRSSMMRSYVEVFQHENNPANIINYIKAIKDRDALSKSVFQRICHIPSLILTGNEAQCGLPFLAFPNPEQTALNLLGNFQRKSASWIKIPNCGHLAHLEKPEEIVPPMVLFLNGLGYM